ncbi:MAG TPA: hypothetical protein PK771_11795 [Spirochaetota bacterium]|nr:hypothetical protein [Spirochaetota bacterium]
MGETSSKDKILSLIEEWITDYDKHDYDLLNQDINISITYSVGISFKTDKTFDLNYFIKKVIDNLDDAKEQGGNQIVTD